MQPRGPRPPAFASEEQNNNGNNDGEGRRSFFYELSLRPRDGASERRRPRSSPGPQTESGQNENPAQGFHGELGQDTGPAQAHWTANNVPFRHAFDPLVDPLDSVMAGASKRLHQTIETAKHKSIADTLHEKGAVVALAYHSESPNPQANDIWPHCRASAELTARYYFLDPNKLSPPDSQLCPPENRQGQGFPLERIKEPFNRTSCTSKGRPKWNLPVELVELIAAFLSRDDIKALRLTSRELNHNISQAMFQTVVVPFNTEIYGMLGNELKPDYKGKKRAMFEMPGYSWKNFSGDENYNGHGLDVFRGFGRHIVRYGMSFDVNEDTLAMPLTKQLTEKKTSFWGRYDWPYEGYCRFDAVAGLETAADETPRMKIAFSELTKVKELALSINNGLGWLNGPDKSIRSQILQKSSSVFGTNKAVLDRRAQAQQELWRHIQSCFQEASSDIRHATLYKIDAAHPLSELKDIDMLADVQPKIPYLDPRLVREATPHDMTDIPVPTSFDDPYVLERFVSAPSPSDNGILFVSVLPPPDAGQVVNPVIPASLTQAQQEWLLETEWAQRAFISSYMLSIIDNPATFQLVHSLNLSSLSDCYLKMLHRSDFWDALPNLHDVTLMVTPGWRTVRKDQAGFVTTSMVNPALSANAIFALLCDHVAKRPSVRSLTVGWTTGGEHAEGLYARNKLLFPAPVVDWRVPSDTGFYSPPLTDIDSGVWPTRPLELPHVERLRLKNCWITPSRLLNLVKDHDSHCLKELVLDSVSLTAMMRPGRAILHAAAQPANAPQNHFAQLSLNATLGVAQNLPGQQQVLQVYVHTLQTQLQQLQANANPVQQNYIATLQTQLQHRLQQIHNLYLQTNPQAQGQGSNQTAAPIPLQPPVQPQPDQIHVLSIVAAIDYVASLVTQLQNHNVFGQQPVHHPMPMNNQALVAPESVLRAIPREGSWADIIDRISPGTNLSDFGSVYSKADKERTTSLQEIDFISCGYARLNHILQYDQSAIDGYGALTTPRHAWFTQRLAALSPAMMSTKWGYLAEIVQDVNPVELATLDTGWNLRTGWEDREKAHAVEFDGLLPGGTGRFTGTIRQSDRMVDKESQSSDDSHSSMCRENAQPSAS
ncbi:hypothetical protein yc1106_07520 [Curvularia clavata]|uniref:F-box domain-containing protein n=1 Tax=Curvularia clavata TaxID=95742 RepID=A0A9Q8ZBR8_CURCL|nr:hypothetical protein yc1106_07520 [Curvularia clavata]